MFLLLLHLAYADYAYWMKYANDNSLITDLAIPGTFASCISDSQSLVIQDQLNIGVRWFDLTLNNETNVIFYNSITNYTFTDVQTILINFLTKYSSECILLKITSTDTTSFYKIFNNIINKQYYWNSYSVPKLKNIRGKIFIIQDFYNSSLEYFKYDDLQKYDDITMNDCDDDKTIYMKNSIQTNNLTVCVELCQFCNCTLKNNSDIINRIIDNFVHNISILKGIVSYSFITEKYSYRVLSKNNLTMDQSYDIMVAIIVSLLFIAILIFPGTEITMCCLNTTICILKFYYFSKLFLYYNIIGRNGIEHLFFGYFFTFVIGSCSSVCMLIFYNGGNIYVHKLGSNNFLKIIFTTILIYGNCIPLYVKIYTYGIPHIKPDVWCKICSFLIISIPIGNILTDLAAVVIHRIFLWMFIPHSIISVCIFVLYSGNLKDHENIVVNTMYDNNDDVYNTFS